MGSYAPGDTMYLQPGPLEGIDAFIELAETDGYPNRNWGTHEAVVASAWTAQGEPLVVRSLLTFDLSAISPSVKIKRAKLSLFAVAAQGVGEGHSTLSGSNMFELVRVVSPWHEDAVTWNSQPIIADTGAVRLPASMDDWQDYLQIDVTRDVADMIAHPSANHGWMVKLVREDYYRRVIFGSSDHADPAKRPKLSIEF